MSGQLTKMYSACPVVKRETIELFDDAEVGGRYIEVPFEKEILWLRRSSATVVLRHKGVDVKEIIGLTDISSGFLACVKEAIRRDAPDTAKRYSVLRTDALTVEVDVVIEDEPVLEIPPKHPLYESWRGEGYCKQYFQLYYGHRWRRRDTRERLATVVVSEWPALWSSARHPIERGVLPPDIEKILASVEV